MNSVLKRVTDRLMQSANKVVDGFVFSEKEIQSTLFRYEGIISKHFLYYAELTDLERERFLNRVYHFRKSKQFHYDGLLASDEIEILISASAVQITFGLRRYKMPVFKDIYVLADQYRMGLQQQEWVGHVNRSGIYLSWKHFLLGYSANNDRYNVGLHEMAHALEYVNFLGFFGVTTEFADDFMLYKRQAELTFPDDQYANMNLFSEQGKSNYHEAWAEGVEIFFENPAELNQYYPNLYRLIKKLLNQDPLNQIKILKPF
jgi:Mlc titration factor MtfA (ptsG expression regulator)